MNRTRCLLVVEDDTFTRDLLEELFDSEGYQVLTATDGAAAFTLLKREPLDLILLDMKMPGMDGWEFARRYAEWPEPKPPVVVISAAPDVSQRAAEIGAQCYLAKPFELEELLQAIDGVCSSSSGPALAYISMAPLAHASEHAGHGERLAALTGLQAR